MFIAWFRAVRDYPTEFGRKITITRNQNQSIKAISIKFSHQRTFNFHYSKQFAKKKPLELFYNKNKCSLTIAGSHEAENPYENCVSH